MGSCIGTTRDGSSPNGDSSDGTGGVSIGRNQALKCNVGKWKSDVPLTDGQLRSKRDEFWETAPAFEGRKEIWDALRAASCALESGDHQLAQAIVDGASISLPAGSLMDCYDELGNRYQLPIYVLSAPSNLIEDYDQDASPIEEAPPEKQGVEVEVKFHLSTGKDLKLNVHTTDSILRVKRRIQELEGIHPNRQRLYFSGKQLIDKMRIEDAKVHKGYTVQVIVACQSPPPPPVES
ncbi:hypothetical protein CAPTEDRAFT_211288 [Capitella teleta]|uniref:Ubiquitin-like domain-containing protein n=1 Tax=Capitella teleta TaxID=283909 RepID=R7TQ12_CAPTE|nr:hypothetical protein CAPTEDRAFT_211288 [Capitella teleta]|eukprot:ELT93596.1 hypothetical protein CAPTEDRAFT_211288 [Capitella teleta]